MIKKSWALNAIAAAFVALSSCFGAFAAAAVPDKPGNAVATTNRTDGIRLTWAAVDGASYYIVYRYGGKTSQTGLVQTKVTTTSYLDTSCEAGVDVPYRVRAFNSSGAGGAYSAYIRGLRKVLLEPYVGGNVSVNPLANGGVAQPLKVRCNVDWTAKASSWINLNSAAFDRSNDATELGFSLEPNTTGDVREGTITVYAGQESATLRVLQGAVEVPGYDTWCGDSALAVVEDAAFPEAFVFRPEYTGGFVSHSDGTATGGSCLRSSPIDVGGRAVVSWGMPSAWKLRFRWRKDTSKSADSLCLYVGGFDSSGRPDLASATMLMACASTEWAYAEVDSQSAEGAEALFFVYEKKSGGTSGTASGFGFIDDFLLMTAPREISFAYPQVRLVGNEYVMNMPCDATVAVETVVTFSHTVTYGGEEHVVKGVVYPNWRKVTASDYFLSFAQGSGDDENKTVFSSRETGGSLTVAMEASYEVAGVTKSEQLTVNIAPPALGALDCRYSGVSLGSALDWISTSDPAATNGSCVSCASPPARESRSFSVLFDGRNQYTGDVHSLFSFNYRMQSRAADESVYVTVDDSPAITLPATGDADWHRVSIYVPDTSTVHEVKWTYSKTGGMSPGSGVSIDFVELGELPTSLVVDNAAQTVRIADYAVSVRNCYATVLKGAEWMSAAPAAVYGGKTSMQVSAPIELGVAANGTGQVRGGKARVSAGDFSHALYIVQSATDDTTVTDACVRPSASYPYYYANVVQGTQAVFTASFTLGGQAAEGFSDLEWIHDFGDDATVEDGVLTVNESEGVNDGSVGFMLGDRACWLTVKAHPPLSRVVPSGLDMTADGWWVERNAEDGLYLQTDRWGAQGTEKTLTATVTGPGVFRCEGRGFHAAGFYLDGERQGGVGGSDWTERQLDVPEGEHVISITYQKEEPAGDSYDISAIRNLTWSPVSFYGFALHGPSEVMGGEKVTFSLFKTFREAATGYVMEVPETVGDIDDVGVSTGDSRTRGLLGLELSGQNGISVKVPLSVQWADQVMLSVDVSMGGMVGVLPTAVFDVTPTTITGLVDSSTVLEMSLPGDGDFAEALSQADETAVGGSCLRLTSRNTARPSKLELKVLDAGTLTFSYRLRALYNDPDYPASLRIYVDGDEQSARYATNAWTSVSVDVAGVGPHVVSLEFTPANVRPAESWCDIDNMEWTSDGGDSSIVNGVVVTGPASAEDTDTLLYSLAIDGDVWSRAGGGSMYPTNWAVRADEWRLQCLSGDTNALRISYIYDTCEVKVSETVSEASVFTVIGRYSIGGTTYEGGINVSVPPRTTPAAAIFDSGEYDNCYFNWSSDWYGSFTDPSEGASCAQSGNLESGRSAYLCLTVWGKGTLEFDWKVSGAADAYLEFTKESQGRTVAKITTDVQGWQHVAIVYGDDEDCSEKGVPIEHQSKWRFFSGSGVSEGENCGCVDNVTWSGTTLSPIRGVAVDVKSSLVPGETAPISFLYYRYDKDYNRVPAPDAGLPDIESVELDYVPDPALERYISFNKDGSGTYTVTVAADCNVTGTFTVKAKYTLYGQERYGGTLYEIQVDEASPMSAPLLGAGGRSLSAMAANGVNTVGECYTAGLDPDDAEAKLTVSVTMTNGVPYITWSPNLPDRTYIIKGKASLADREWTAPTNSTHRFFKVEVEKNK